MDEADPWNSTTPSVVAFRNLYGHNETLMNNSSQQFVRDEMVPIIRKFDARTDGEVVCDPLLGWVCSPIAAWTVVTVEVVDPSPYTMTITVLDNNRSRSFNLSGHAIVTTITIDILSDALLDYHVNVKAVDVSGNGAETTEKVTGIIGAVVEFFGSVLQAIWGAVVAAVETVAEAVGWLVDFIVNGLLAVISALTDPLFGMIESWNMQFHDLFLTIRDEVRATGSISGPTKELLMFHLETLLTTLLAAGLGIAVAISLLRVLGPIGIAVGVIIAVAVGGILYALGEWSNSPPSPPLYVEGQEGGSPGGESSGGCTWKSGGWFCPPDLLGGELEDYVEALLEVVVFVLTGMLGIANLFSEEPTIAAAFAVVAVALSMTIPYKLMMKQLYGSLETDDAKDSYLAAIRLAGVLAGVAGVLAIIGMLYSAITADWGNFGLGFILWLIAVLELMVLRSEKEKIR